MSEPDQQGNDFAAEKSKSQIKREMHALQELGLRIVELPQEQFAKITLPESLHDAISDARAIHQHGARKRQLQYIGKLMRGVDAEPIQAQLESILGSSHQATQLLHEAERWRDQLLSGDTKALEKFIEAHPDTDRQYLRQLIRNGQKETAASKAPKSARLLFRYIRDLLGAGHP